MPGVVMILIVLLVFPVLVGMGSAAIAAGLGYLLNRDGEERHRGSELLDLNV